MKYLLIALFILSLLNTTQDANAIACYYDEKYPPPAFESYSMIFIGKAIRIKKDVVDDVTLSHGIDGSRFSDSPFSGLTGFDEVTFEVKKIFKGVNTDGIKGTLIRQLFKFKEGEEYLVFMNMKGKDIEIDACRVKKISEATEDIKKLEENINALKTHNSQQRN